MLATHAFEPVCDARSRALILGTMPSPASVGNGFYYSHPRNRFWPVMAAVFGTPVPVTPEEKRALLLDNGIALWDVLKACNIEGASDASIRAPVPNDIAVLLERAPITHVYTTGNKAGDLYTRLLLNTGAVRIASIRLPSTSPANAGMSLERLIAAYSVIRQNMAGE